MKRDSKQVLTELLVLKAQGGDEAAFRDLYELWSRDLSRLAAIQLKSVSATEEVAQDAWVAIARGLGRLDDPASFPRWAFRILDRRCADWIRRAQKERRVAESLRSDPQYSNGGYGGGEVASGLSEAIARLEPDSRKLLHLYYEAGFTVVDIAEILDVPSGTVKSRLFALREKLKRELEGE